VFAAHGDDVQFTMIDGRVLMEEGTVTGVDTDAIREEASEISSELDAKRSATADTATYVSLNGS
jgi:5-methylthioadenosine/S-adenosylhomocysteine deaminase